MPDDRLGSRPPGAAAPPLSASAGDRNGGDLSCTGDRLERLAELVATGELPLAQPLAPADQQQLEERVRRLRHVRMVQFIARQIAWDIHRERQARMEVSR
ncbi:MAG: hypothetical protein ABSH20_03760 [Tepidisphaeraceae bacterium]